MPNNTCRVYCLLNYYGDGCATFCRARDDQFGHYNCSSLGQKICLDGWYGADCDKAKCRAGCNQQHGYCERPDSCHCRPGWNGSRCDECITYPGCQNGYCLSPWQCICQRNWGGVLCDQDLNYCGTHEPCKNNATCQNIAPGKYKCHCPDGFTGVDCDISLKLTKPATSVWGSVSQLSAGCALNPCLNGGTCYGFNTLIDLVPSSAVALSTTNRTNLQQLNQESSDLLQSTGEQQQQQQDSAGQDRQYRCQCLPGWTGDYCQWTDSPSMTITSILVNTNANSSAEKTSFIPHTTTSTSILTSESSTSSILDKAETDAVFFPNETPNNESFVSILDKTPPPSFTTFLENIQPTQQHVDMKHLISWVVIASIVGVCMASLLLAWCCLLAIERNKLSFIQMNIVRGGDNLTTVSQSTLRRMHEKIRDSLRRSSRNRIKPETKLSIDNVLRASKPPPPPYDECTSSRMDLDRITASVYNSDINYNKSQPFINPTTNSRQPVEILVSKEVLQRDLSLPTKEMKTPIDPVAESRLTCPRHGHLYRMHQHNLEQEVSSSSNSSIDESILVTTTTNSPNYFHHDTYMNHHHQY